MRRQAQIKPSMWVAGMILFVCTVMPRSATFHGQTLDGNHYRAQIWQKGSDVRYHVDAVFVGKAVNMRFLEGQILPPTLRSGTLFTLYLETTVIEKTEDIALKQLVPPVSDDRHATDPDTWDVVARWFMDIVLE